MGIVAEAPAQAALQLDFETKDYFDLVKGMLPIDSIDKHRLNSKVQLERIKYHSVNRRLLANQPDCETLELIDNVVAESGGHIYYVELALDFVFAIRSAAMALAEHLARHLDDPYARPSKRQADFPENPPGVAIWMGDVRYPRPSRKTTSNVISYGDKQYRFDERFWACHVEQRIYTRRAVAKLSIEKLATFDVKAALLCNLHFGEVDIDGLVRRLGKRFWMLAQANQETEITGVTVQTTRRICRIAGLAPSRFIRPKSIDEVLADFRGAYVANSHRPVAAETKINQPQPLN